MLSSDRSTTILRQDPLPLTRAQKWAAFVNVNLDILIYTTIFLFISIPIYRSTGYAMPIQLSLNILGCFTALQLPAQWRRFLHPVLVSSLITVLGVWIFALIRGNSLDNTLYAYETGTKYTQLWQDQKGLLNLGAGDLFSGVLDVSIIALALPMFQIGMNFDGMYVPTFLIPLHFYSPGL